MPKPDANRALSYGGDMKEAGKRAEAVVRDFLCRYPKIKDVKDYTDVDEWRLKDVDFEAVFDNGRIEWIEVKNDSYIATTGNFLYELNRLNHTFASNRIKLGWSAYSHATYFLIYAEDAGELYVFLSKEIQDGFHRYILEKRTVKDPKKGGVRLGLVCTDIERTTVVVPVPLYYFQYRVFRQINSQWRMVKTTWKGERV
jgi:hypothetical protein